VVKNARHSDTLLLAARKHVLPLLDRVPAALTVRDLGQVGGLEDLEQLGIGEALLLGVLLTVGVDDLLAERTDGQVGPLRNEKHVVVTGGLGNRSTYLLVFYLLFVTLPR